MPYNTKPAPPEDMFTDGPEPAAPKTAETDEPGENHTAVLPKSILAGKDFKPGEEVVLKIVAIHDNDVEVEYAPEKGSEETKAEPEEEVAPTPPESGGGDQEMASMME